MSPQGQVRLVPIPNSDHPAPRDCRQVGKTSPGQQITITVILKRAKPLDLADLKGRHLSREEYLNTHGATQQAIDQVRALAARHGLTLVHEDRAARRVWLRGTAQQMEQTFGVDLQDYEHTATEPCRPLLPCLHREGFRAGARVRRHRNRSRPRYPSHRPAAYPLAQASRGRQSKRGECQLYAAAGGRRLRLSHRRQWHRPVHRAHRARWRLRRLRHPDLLRPARHRSAHRRGRAGRWRHQLTRRSQWRRW